MINYPEANSPSSPNPPTNPHTNRDYLEATRYDLSRQRPNSLLMSIASPSTEYENWKNAEHSNINSKLKLKRNADGPVKIVIGKKNVGYFAVVMP
jgi:hypothetical protein